MSAFTDPSSEPIHSRITGTSCCSTSVTTTSEGPDAALPRLNFEQPQKHATIPNRTAALAQCRKGILSFRDRPERSRPARKLNKLLRVDVKLVGTTRNMGSAWNRA